MLNALKNRVKCRLSNFRVPVNSTVRVTFARRLPREEAETIEPLSPVSMSSMMSEKKFDRSSETAEPKQCPESDQLDNAVRTQSNESKFKDDDIDVDNEGVDDHEECKVNSQNRTDDTEKIEPKEDTITDEIDIDSILEPEEVSVPEVNISFEEKNDPSSNLEACVESSDDDQEGEDVEFQRQSPISLTENKDVVFKGALEDSLK